MELSVAVAVGFSPLRRNPMRTLLTILGVIIGVAAGVSNAAVGGGGRGESQGRVPPRGAHTNVIPARHRPHRRGQTGDGPPAGGANMSVIRAGNRTIGGVRLGRGASSRLNEEDAVALRRLPGVAYLSAGLRTRSQIISRGQNWNTSIEGTGAEMP